MFTIPRNPRATLYCQRNTLTAHRHLSLDTATSATQSLYFNHRVSPRDAHKHHSTLPPPHCSLAALVSSTLSRATVSPGRALHANPEFKSSTLTHFFATVINNMNSHSLSITQEKKRKRERGGGLTRDCTCAGPSSLTLNTTCNVETRLIAIHSSPCSACSQFKHPSGLAYSHPESYRLRLMAPQPSPADLRSAT